MVRYIGGERREEGYSGKEGEDRGQDWIVSVEGVMEMRVRESEDRGNKIEEEEGPELVLVRCQQRKDSIGKVHGGNDFTTCEASV